MKWLGLLLFTFLVLISPSTFAINELISRVPGIDQQKPAYIEDVTLVSEPHGAYVEQSMYLSYSDHNAFPGQQVEIIHRFELPEGSVVNDLWLWFGKDVMKALIMDTWKARNIYDSVVSMKRDPAFLSKIGNQYELHVYPLQSGSFRKIKINFITPTKWFGNNALCELPLKFLSASNASVPANFLFREKYPVWGTPSIKERPDLIFYHGFDTTGFIYEQLKISNVKEFSTFNLSFVTNFNSGIFSANNIVPGENSYFQVGILPWKAFEAAQADTSPKRLIAGIDLSGSMNKDFLSLLPNLKNALKSSLRPGDFYNILIAGANKIVLLNPDLLTYSAGQIDSDFDKFAASSYGDSVKQISKPEIIYADFKALTIWSWNGIGDYAIPLYKPSILEALSEIRHANVLASYEHGYENVLDNERAKQIIDSLNNLFQRGGRFVAYFDHNREGLEKLATHYLPNIKVKYSTQQTIQLSRNMDGNIGRYFPESVMHGGGYFFEMNDTSMKAEMVDDQGNPCIVSKRLGNGGLLVVTGLWPFNDDEPMRKLIGMPLLGLNQSQNSNMLLPLLENYRELDSKNYIDKFLTISNCDSLVTEVGTDQMLNTYLCGFQHKPFFNSINLLDGSKITPPSVTIDGNEYYGSGYLLKSLAEKTRSVHLETHLTDWTTIQQRLIPPIHRPIDSISVIPSFSNSGQLMDLIEVNKDRSDPERPLFFLGSTSGAREVDVNIYTKFYGLEGMQSKKVTISFNDTTLRIIPSMMGYEKIKDKLVHNSADTAGIVSLGMKYNLLCDYTALIALEPNDTIHFMVNPFDESVLSVEDKGVMIDTSYALLQNYPNPFNPSTTIKFNIANEGMVTLKVYDILGKEVKVLVNEFIKPGTYSVRFNGSELSSGVYIYQLKAKGILLNRKMLLIK